ncbi:hypothetical protein DJ568_01455 [Mucilaginibacter hurinus]|uniref:Sensor of ECF-type sigma factor n=1 Tax=Mucilaginibacter hurinus TaxID=2201324 RepID=A0A367GV59_9SPHI|nr:hypothetical protein [Mucilaginibacter hurinus]RCH56553.1 hypothetical protein DJ568_01455 [Mucilaginibacter hurinus]
MNKLAKFICFIIFVLGVSYHAFAQVPGAAQGLRDNYQHRGTTGKQPGSRLALIKKEFLSKQLNLTPEESKKFWPLYRQYQQQLINIRRLKRLNSSDAQANGTEQLKKELYYETEMVNIRKRYQEEFLKILSAEKVSELYKSEREFNDEVIKQLSERSERAGN